MKQNTEVFKIIFTEVKKTNTVLSKSELDTNTYAVIAESFFDLGYRIEDYIEYFRHCRLNDRYFPKPKDMKDWVKKQRALKVQHDEKLLLESKSSDRARGNTSFMKHCLRIQKEVIKRRLKIPSLALQTYLVKHEEALVYGENTTQQDIENFVDNLDLNEVLMGEPRLPKGKNSTGSLLSTYRPFVDGVLQGVVSSKGLRLDDVSRGSALIGGSGLDAESIDMAKTLIEKNDEIKKIQRRDNKFDGDEKEENYG